jgi:hypothetical protein
LEIIAIIHTLWRRRLRVGLALVLSLAVGGAIAAMSHQTQIGIAVAHVLVDTPQSSLADLSANGGTATSIQAGLLANLTASPPLEEIIARKSGAPLRQMVVVPPPSTSGVADVLTQSASKLGPPKRSYLLSVTVDSVLPIIAIQAQAPDPTAAARLANGAVAALQQYVGTLAVTERIKPKQVTVLRPLGSAIAGSASVGTRKLYAAVAAVLLFVLSCAAIVAGPRVAALWRETKEDGLASEDRAGTRLDDGHSSGPVVTDEFAAGLAETLNEVGLDWTSKEPRHNVDEPEPAATEPTTSEDAWDQVEFGNGGERSSRSAFARMAGLTRGNGPGA